MKANIKVMQKMVLGLVTTMLEQWSGGNEKNRKLKEPKTVLQGSFEINEAGTSRRLFRVEAKLYIQPFDEQMDTEILKKWLRQLEVYFGCRGYNDRKKITFAHLKLSKHVLLW